MARYMMIPVQPQTNCTTKKFASFINIEEAWAPFKHDIPAKGEQGKIGEWLFDNIGYMGNNRVSLDEWDLHRYRWAWSLSTGKFDLPVGIYFLHREDALRFVLTYSNICGIKI